MKRYAEIERNTRETQIKLAIDLDGSMRNFTKSPKQLIEL